MAERTKESALRVVLQLKNEATAEAENADVRAVLGSELVGRLLDMAWRHQFDPDRTAARRDVRTGVSDAVEAQLLARSEE